MSKSRGNVVNPDDIVSAYGADAFRLYEMFMGPLEMSKPWNTKGVEGVYRFLGRVWRLFVDEASEVAFEQALSIDASKGEEHLACLQRHKGISDDAEPTAEQLKSLHQCIKKVTDDLEGMRFNTAISAMMVFVNEATAWDIRPASSLRSFLVLLHPFAPHLAEELYAMLGNDPEQIMAYEPWPAYEESHLKETKVSIPVQVNGKLRDRVEVPADMDKATLESMVLASDKVQIHTEGKEVKKVIIVPGKLVNLVVK